MANKSPRLIEVALPLDAINRASAREKSIRHGHPSTLHLWWARRPLAAARAVLFASLVPDPDHEEAPGDFVEACRSLARGEYSQVRDTPRNRLFDFIATLVKWESTTDEKVIDQARELIRIGCEGDPPPVLDPFAGGGSIPLEAQRLGLTAYASDLNPVAVLINKAMIEIPPLFAGQPPVNPRDRAAGTAGDAQWRGAAGLAADVRYYGEWMRERAQERIGHLYPQHKGETVIAWLWARTVQSPNPAVRAEVPLVNSFALSKKKGREHWAEPIIERLEGEDGGPTHRVRFEVREGKPPADRDGTMLRRQGGICAVSGAPMPYSYIREEGKAGRMGEMLMAIVTEGNRRRNYHSPTTQHEEIVRKAREMKYFRPKGSLPLRHRNFQTPGYGLYEFGDLFTPRQLVALTTFSDLVAEVREQIEKDALAAGLDGHGWTLQNAPAANYDAHELRSGAERSGAERSGAERSGAERSARARARARALITYLSFAVSRAADRLTTICRWDAGYVKVSNTFARQAIPMVWAYAEGNPFSRSTGNWTSHVNWIAKALETVPAGPQGWAIQQDAGAPAPTRRP